VFDHGQIDHLWLRTADIVAFATTDDTTVEAVNHNR
jgi:hypothetical protein